MTPQPKGGTPRDELKLCPFCGGRADCRPDEVGSGGQHVPPYHVGCFDCKMLFTEEEAEWAITEWNTRAGHMHIVINADSAPQCKVCGLFEPAGGFTEPCVTVAITEQSPAPAQEFDRWHEEWMGPVTGNECFDQLRETRRQYKDIARAAWNAALASAPQEQVAQDHLPTEAMLIAARDWSAKKYGKPIGDDAARGCWNAMLAAAPAAPVKEADERLRELVLQFESRMSHMSVHCLSVYEGKTRIQHCEDLIAALREKP